VRQATDCESNQSRYPKRNDELLLLAARRFECDGGRKGFRGPSSSQKDLLSTVSHELRHLSRASTMFSPFATAVAARVRKRYAGEGARLCEGLMFDRKLLIYALGMGVSSGRARTGEPCRNWCRKLWLTATSRRILWQVVRGGGSRHFLEKATSRPCDAACVSIQPQCNSLHSNRHHLRWVVFADEAPGDFATLSFSALDTALAFLKSLCTNFQPFFG